MSKLTFPKSIVVAAILSIGQLSQSADLTVAIPNRIITLNPTETLIAQDRFVLPLIFEYLVEADPYGEIVNRLITKWSYAADVQILTLSIASGHRFSDGSAVSARSVVDTFTILCRKGSRAASQFVGLVGCGSDSSDGGVKLRGTEQVDFHINIDPNAFLYQLAYGRGPVFKSLENGSRIGSGPYQLESIGVDQVVLKANPYASRKVHVDRLLFDYVPEADLSSAVQQRRFDVASMYLLSTIQKIKTAPYLPVIHTANVSQVLVVNPGKGPFRNSKFRRRFRDRIEAAKINECKNAEPATGLIPRGVPGSVVRFTTTEMGPMSKPERVGRNALPIRFYRHRGRFDACEEKRIVAAGKDLGLSISFTYMDDYPSLIAKYLDRQTDGYVELIPFVARDPSPVLRRLALNSNDSYFFYHSRKIENLLESALRQPNIDERIPMYRSINAEIYRDASIIPLYYVAHTVLMDPCTKLKEVTLGNYNPNSFLFLLDVTRTDGCRADQR